MRWEQLFADLEARAEELDRSERAVEIAERSRIEAGRLTIAGRLAAATGSQLRIRVAGGATASGRLQRSGPGWFLLDAGGGHEWVLATGAVLSIVGCGRWSGSVEDRGVRTDRLGIRHVLRAIATDRSAATIHLVDGSAISGTIDRVGQDFLDVALHGDGEARRRDLVHGAALVHHDAIAMIRRQP
ncbi:MAG TPA: hypothetical protein VGN35_13435 [Jatrophihabitantaceae bacterium]|nr:hypothetical protein [Jatrophihabitantaceae bacterium]